MLADWRRSSCVASDHLTSRLQQGNVRDGMFGRCPRLRVRVVRLSRFVWRLAGRVRPV